LSLRQAARAVTAMYDEALRPTGLRSTQLAVLMAAKNAPCVTLCGLADLLVVDRTTLTRNLQPLEKKGLLRIESGADRRARSVCITEAGLQVVEQAMPIWAKIQSKAVQGLGEDRYKRMVDDLSAAVRVAQNSD
jgi:DNA-binding MarR family transcriptional regulator